LAENRDTRLAEDVRDLGLAETRGVVYKCQMVVPLIDVKTAQTVGVRERAEAAELLEAQRRLQFKRNFGQCHGTDYSSSEGIEDEPIHADTGRFSQDIPALMTPQSGPLDAL
jgi:hypothetical protein